MFRSLVILDVFSNKNGAAGSDFRNARRTNHHNDIHITTKLLST